MVDMTPVSGTPDAPVTPPVQESTEAAVREEASVLDGTAPEASVLDGTAPEAPASDGTTSEAEALTPTPVDYAQMEAEDLRTLRELFPAALSLRSLSQLSNPARYGELRDLGLSAKEAYLATEGHVAPPSDNRAHLHSAVPRTVGGADGSISAAELSAARELFNGLSDHEIRRLYKRVSASNK